MRSVRSSLLVAPVADGLVASDLPALPADRRTEVVRFACRRIDDLPTPTRAGVLTVAAVARVIVVVPGGDRAVQWLGGRGVPVLGDYVRLLRSLALAFVWENWPASSADGGDRPGRDRIDGAP